MFDLKHLFAAVALGLSFWVSGPAFAHRPARFGRRRAGGRHLDRGRAGAQFGVPGLGALAPGE